MWEFLKVYIISNIVMILLLAGLSRLMGSASTSPSRLTGTESAEVIISDQAGILTDSDGLKEALSDFHEKTGIVPAFYTVNNESWQTNYDDLEAYAYDLYMNTFPDESHWLIVYSEPETPQEDFNDWYWEGIQGDDTVNILTEDKADSFNEKLQDYLTFRSQYTVGEAVTKAFKETSETIMTPEAGSDMDFSGYFTRFRSYILIFSLAYALFRQRKQRKPYKYSELKEVKDAVNGEPRLGKCEYCEGLYKIGVDLTCPHCGAPLPSPSSDEQTKQAVTGAE